jgi:hypothetical protein
MLSNNTIIGWHITQPNDKVDLRDDGDIIDLPSREKIDSALKT